MYVQMLIFLNFLASIWCDKKGGVTSWLTAEPRSYGQDMNTTVPPPNTAAQSVAPNVGSARWQHPHSRIFWLHVCKSFVKHIILNDFGESLVLGVLAPFTLVISSIFYINTYMRFCWPDHKSDCNPSLFSSVTCKSVLASSPPDGGDGPEGVCQ